MLCTGKHAHLHTCLYKQEFNQAKKGFDENLDPKISCIVTKNVTKIGGKTIGQNILV